MRTFEYYVMNEDGDELESFSTLKDARLFAKKWSKENQDRCYICSLGEEYYENGREVDTFI